MATIGEVIQEASYVGNAGASGGTSGVITIDTSPVQELARFTMFANKADYDQRQKDIDAKVAELAEFTALDLNGTRAKDKDQLVKEWDEVQKLSADYARYTPTSQKDKVEKKLEYDKKLNQLKNNINSGNKRAIGYNVRLNAINNDPSLSGTEKTAKLKDLDKEFDDTDITTPMAAEDEYNAIVPDIPPAPIMEFDVTEKTPDGNSVLVTSYDNFDAEKAGVLAFSFLNNLEVAPLPANATERERKDYEARQAAYKKGGARLYTDGVNLLNEAISDPKYKDANGNIDYNAISASNKLAASNLALIDGWNKYAADKTAKIEAGVFYDKTGIVPLKNTQLRKENYLQIDKSKPVSAEQLIKAQMWAKSVSDKKQQKFIETDDAIQRGNLAVSQGELALKKRLAASAAKTGKTQEQILAEMGNAFDSFGGAGGLVSVGGTNATPTKDGVWLKADGVKYTGNMRMAGKDIPDGIRNLIQQANPEYFKDEEGKIDATGKPATVFIRDGVVEGIQYDGLNQIDRRTILNYQINEVSKFTEKGNPFIPNYGAGYGGTSSVSTKTTSAPAASNNLPSYSTEELKRAKWTDAQIQQAVSAGKIKLK